MSDIDIIRLREELMSWGLGLDAKRPAAWVQYGYRENLTFQDYLNAYERGGAAHGAVHRILDGSWQQTPRIKQPEADKPTAWEKGAVKTLKAVDAFVKLMDFDRRNLIGRYSGLIYRMGDGKRLDEPLGTGAKLVDLIPVFEDQLKVTAWHSEKADTENYGKPKMFQYRARQVNALDQQGRPDEWADVHPSRVQILAEGAVAGNFFEGIPLLKAGFNHLTDLEKIAGGTGEGFLKNSARTMSFEFDAAASPQVITQNPDGTASTKTVREVIEEQTRSLNKNQDSSIVLQGGKANTLKTEVADPKPSFEVSANLFAASIRLPFTIMFGQQTGRLASDEDKADAIARYKGRQRNVLTPMLEELVRRMQACGALDQGEFEIEWPDIGAPSDAQKVDVLLKMTQAMTAAFNAGLTEPIFDTNELRKVMGFEPRADDGMPTEADKKAAEEAEAAAQAAKSQKQQPVKA